MTKFQLGSLHHIGLVVPDLDVSVAYYRDVMGVSEISDLYQIPDRGLKIRFVNLLTGRVELIEPDRKTSSLYKFIEENPKGGQHHICFEVENMREATSHMEDQGVRLLSEPFMGILGSPIVFLNPDDTQGVLIELMETPLLGTHTLGPSSRAG